MRDDLDALRVDVVHAQEVVGGALAREHPAVDRVESRRRRRPEIREDTARGRSRVSDRHRSHSERSSGMPQGWLFR